MAWATKAGHLFDELKKNGMVVQRAEQHRAVTPVMQGEAAVFGAVDYVSYGNIDGESHQSDFPPGGTVIAHAAMMIAGNHGAC